MPQISWGQTYATLASRFGSRPAVVSAAGTLTYQEVFACAAAVAGRLRGAGVQPGEPVAIFLRNEPAAVWTSYGVTLSGAAETPLNAALGRAEIEYSVKLLNIRHFVTDSRAIEALQGLPVQFHDAHEMGARPSRVDPRHAVDGKAWGKIVLTSGTTGLPKAIVHSHERRWLATVLLRACLPQLPAPSSRALLMTPFSHGASLITYAYLDHGASIHLMDGVRIEEIESALQARSVTSIFAPPTVLAKLAAAFEGRSFAGIDTIFCGTATLSPQVYAQARAIFGPAVRVTYGMSEMFNPITVLPPADTDRFYASEHKVGTSLGWPVTGVEVKIVHDTPDQDQAMPGDIHIRSPHQMIGQVDQAGFHALPEEAWHRTGDIGFISENGELHLVGRANDVIKSGGYKVFPQEIERVLRPVTDGEVVVVGLPSEYWGQVIVAVAEGVGPDWEARARAAVEPLTRYKRPRAYIALPALPRGAQDKIQRGRIIEQVQRSYRIEDGPQPQLHRLQDEPSATHQTEEAR